MCVSLRRWQLGWHQILRKPFSASARPTCRTPMQSSSVFRVSHEYTVHSIKAAFVIVSMEMLLTFFIVVLVMICTQLSYLLWPFLSASRWQCRCREEHCNRLGQPDGPPGKEDHLCPDQGGLGWKELGQPEQSKTAEMLLYILTVNVVTLINLFHVYIYRRILIRLTQMCSLLMCQHGSVYRLFILQSS